MGKLVVKLVRTHRIAALLVAVLLAVVTTSVEAVIPASERTALLNLYASTNGAGWTDSTNWNGAIGTECTWYGVTCNPGETTVTIVNLELNNLDGVLPGDLNNLTGLLRFFVGGNTGLTGSIPALSGLTNLTHFYADFSGLQGSIPALTGLTSLQYFNVEGNGMTGSIPALTGLTNLLELRFNQNQLTGSIPALTGLTNLYNFRAFDNQLTGSIPALSGLTSLSSFLVDGNQLTGSIPSLTGLTSLFVFRAHDNQLTGSIPALTGLTNLNTFFVHNNQLTGSIPALAGLAQLSFFYVQNNQLTGSIPALAGLTNLQQFYAFDNQLTGTIPALSGLTSLKIFFVAINQLTGSIPALSGLTNLRDFLVENNQLSGPVPSLTGLTNLRKLVIYNNQLTGNIPATPFPSSLLASGSSLCPNLLNHTPNLAWDAATGQTPWFATCTAPPGAPTAVSATAGNANATVTFSPPASDGGSAITSYTATCGGQSASGIASPILVTGLTNGTSYTCTVKATNAVGVGPASSPSNSVTPATVPGAPGIGAVTAGNAQIRVTFVAPLSNGGSAITSYTATCGSVSATKVASPIFVTGLSNGTSYTCTVRATNAKGSGPASIPSNSVIPSTVPGAPGIGVADPGDAQIVVRFSPPASNGGGAITGYTASCAGQSANGAASPIIVTGLTNGISYTCAVTATNAAGVGPASAPSNSVIPATVPGAPIIGVAASGNAKIRVAFSPSISNGGSTVTHYTAICGGHSVSGVATPIFVTGLTNGISYTCTVTATNAKGTGPASAASNSVTPSVTQPNPTVIVNTVPGTVPDAPVMGVATAGDGRITVPFGPPANEGGSAINSYTATCGGHHASGATAPIVVTGLANGNTYSCTVTATNAEGTGPASAESNSVRPEADTRTRLDSSVNPSLPGMSVTFTATVSGDALAGSVLFRDGAIALAGCAAVALAGNQAQCVVSGLPLGSHPISALYSGDGINVSSLSPTLEQVVSPPTLDVDASLTETRYDAHTDGLLIVRYLFGLTGSALTADALGTTATRTDPAAIKTFLDGMRTLLDIDGDGRADALTDGLLIQRYLLGLRGDALIAGAVAPVGTRVTAPVIEDYLETLLP